MQTLRIKIASNLYYIGPKLQLAYVLAKKEYLKRLLYTGPYPERISYQLTNMGTQKKCPKKPKSLTVDINLFVCKRKFNETRKDFSINYPYNQCGKTIFSF